MEKFYRVNGPLYLCKIGLITKVDVLEFNCAYNAKEIGYTVCQKEVAKDKYDYRDVFTGTDLQIKGDAFYVEKGDYIILEKEPISVNCKNYITETELNKIIAKAERNIKINNLCDKLENDLINLTNEEENGLVK